MNVIQVKYTNKYNIKYGETPEQDEYTERTPKELASYSMTVAKFPYEDGKEEEAIADARTVIAAEKLKNKRHNGDKSFENVYFIVKSELVETV